MAKHDAKGAGNPDQTGGKHRRPDPVSGPLSGPISDRTRDQIAQDNQTGDSYDRDR